MARSFKTSHSFSILCSNLSISLVLFFLSLRYFTIQANVLVALSLHRHSSCLFQLITIVSNVCVGVLLETTSAQQAQQTSRTSMCQRQCDAFLLHSLTLHACPLAIIVSVSSTPCEYCHKLALTYWLPDDTSSPHDFRLTFTWLDLFTSVWPNGAISLSFSSGQLFTVNVKPTPFTGLDSVLIKHYFDLMNTD